MAYIQYGKLSLCLMSLRLTYIMANMRMANIRMPFVSMPIVASSYVKISRFYALMVDCPLGLEPPRGPPKLPFPEWLRCSGRADGGPVFLVLFTGRAFDR